MRLFTERFPFQIIYIANDAEGNSFGDFLDDGVWAGASAPHTAP